MYRLRHYNVRKYNASIVVFIVISILSSCTSLFYSSIKKEIYRDPVNPKICFCYKGEWSHWNEFSLQSVSRYLDGSGIIIKNAYKSPIFECRITNFHCPYSSSVWTEYEGTVFYYVNDLYPTAEALAKANHLLIPYTRDDRPSVKRSTKCRIKIAPYVGFPTVYNVWFDNIGVGIDITGIQFESK